MSPTDLRQALLSTAEIVSAKCAMKTVREIADTSALVGLKLQAVSVRDGYWNLDVYLRCSDDHVLRFFCTEYQAGNYFDVYAIDFSVDAIATSDAKTMNDLGSAYAVRRAELLWRTEWIEKIEKKDNMIGFGPHHSHCIGRIGSAPNSAVAVCDVLAGVLLTSVEGNRMLVHAEAGCPMNVEIILNEEEISASLNELYN